MTRKHVQNERKVLLLVFCRCSIVIVASKRVEMTIEHVPNVRKLHFSVFCVCFIITFASKRVAMTIEHVQNDRKPPPKPKSTIKHTQNGLKVPPEDKNHYKTHAKPSKRHSWSRPSGFQGSGGSCSYPAKHPKRGGSRAKRDMAFPLFEGHFGRFAGVL